MRTRGRPRLAEDDRTVNVTFRLRVKQYELTEREAKRADLPLSDWLRRLVDRACRPKDRA